MCERDYKNRESSRHDIPFNRNCFLQYHNQFVTPNNWDTYFNFSKNTAPLGSAIYSTSLLPCMWETSYAHDDVVIPLNWSFVHSNDNTSFSAQVFTEIARIIPNNIAPICLYAIPGISAKLPLNFLDDVEHHINLPVWLVDW